MNVYVVLDIEDVFVVGVFATLDLAKYSMSHIKKWTQDHSTIWSNSYYRIILLPLVTSIDQDQQEPL